MIAHMLAAQIAIAHAGVIKRFCARMLNSLVQEDPWPLAEHSNETLLWLVETRADEEVVRELNHRLSAGRLSAKEIERFRRACR
jgi:hypothetical protein